MNKQEVFVKVKVLKHKTFNDSFGKFFDNEIETDISTSSVPQAFPATSTMDGLKEFSSQNVRKQLDEYDLIGAFVLTEEQLHREKEELLCDFFSFFKANGEMLIGKTVEELVKIYLNAKPENDQLQKR